MKERERKQIEPAAQRAAHINLSLSNRLWLCVCMCVCVGEENQNTTPQRATTTMAKRQVIRGMA